jgi:hypothetical protein
MGYSRHNRSSTRYPSRNQPLRQSNNSITRSSVNENHSNNLRHSSRHHNDVSSHRQSSNYNSHHHIM